MDLIPLRHVLRRLRFRHLELLRILETAGTVRAAADEMQLTQPAITRMLQETEAIFGARLFDRGARGLTPTRLGVKLIAHAVAQINELEGMRQEIEISRDHQLDLLRMGAFSGTGMIAEAVSALTQRNPDVRVVIREARINQLFDDLLRGELDCVIGSLPPEELRGPRVDGLRMQPVAEESVRVVAACNSHWVRKRRLGLADLLGARWVLPPSDSLLRRAFMRAHLNIGIVPPAPIVEVMSPLTIRSMIESGGVDLGLVRSGHAAEDERLGVLKALPVSPALTLPPLMVFTRRASSLRKNLVAAMTSALRDASRVERVRKQASKRPRP